MESEQLLTKVVAFVGSGSDGAYRWWAAAGVAQLVWVIASYKRGCAGNSNLMPLKAFAVASLFVGATASAAVASVKASGIHKVEDAVEVGGNIRTRIRDSLKSTR